MLDNTPFGITPAAPPFCETSAADLIGHLVGRLKAARIGPRLLDSAAGPTAGGIALRVAVQPSLASTLATERVMRRLTALVGSGIPLTVSLVDLGADDTAIASLESFCTLLHGALSAEGLSSRSIGLSVQTHVLPLQAYLVISTAVLGRGPRFVILDSLQMRHHDKGLEHPRVQDETDRNWSLLWRCRHAPPALPTAIPAYAASVTTRCALLGDEAATAILPELGLQVPIDTAWLPLILHLPDFSDGRGRLCWTTLLSSLRCCIDLGEQLLDCLHWLEAAQQADAWQNRRLAVALEGVGDLVLETGADPSDFRCLRWIDNIVARLEVTLRSRSRALARKTEPLPALLQTEPTAGWPEGARKSDWRDRWRSALANSAVRHRNLLVMSPYTVVPAGRACAADFIDLLPVLQHADAFSFRGTPAGAFRSVSEFANFHRRAWAVMQRRNAASFVAAGA